MIKRMLPWMIMILVVITLITGAAFILWFYVIDDKISASGQPSIHETVKDEKAPTIPADERMELTVPIDDVITNLSNIGFVVKLNFSFQLDTKKAKEEFNLIVPSVKAAIVSILSDTSPEEIKSSQGKDSFLAKVMNQVNSIMLDGKVKQIEITDFIIQGS